MNNQIDSKIADWLNEKAAYYNNPSFVETDPVSIPHMFSKKEDIEIAALFSALLAWGNRKAIISGAKQLMQRMDNAPFQFVTGHTQKDLKNLQGFVYRTFNSFDAATLCEGLKNIYTREGGMQSVFSEPIRKNKNSNAFDAIGNFRNILLSYPHEARFEKHISSPERGSAAKRLNMFLRWMVRRDQCGVDFGLWTDTFPMSRLLIPLDVHSARIARETGILSRLQTDAKAVLEVSENCRLLDPNDPARFDFALFGTGINEKHYF
ncbi:MAG: TIGR02757 family protein [Bacteroidetes bacterium GWF2_43_63]|nr:MAG: TIGR02757 family protein [Bacteroidetes bacterium GWE2_42_42]OFY56038.1 MAG: TIGR02757 family protein [Bacteroidetes bacterium GWF2_43_63]HBG70717.1 TIGR02757 family protein [Bacteroidales bacterium]HCB62455.1 TIGR02757 family protein [Bacteroidales bacterium]HCY21910.1 TIGR02757 family protein [Bacteroidales bacterium]